MNDFVERYPLRNPDAIPTPAMLIYRDAVERNIAALCALVGGGRNLLVHAKTHKSPEVARMQLAAGIAGFKTATLAELAMVLEAGAEVAVLAYPLLQQAKIERFAELSAAYQGARVYGVVSRPLHLERLEAVARRRGARLRVLLDVDVGMTRTGVPAGPAAESLYRALHDSEWLLAGGLHAYDGHDHEPDPGKRAALAAAHIGELKALRDHIAARGWSQELIVGGGSFSFPYWAREAGMLGSPGTTIYWDARYRALLPDLPFEWAAFVLTEVIDVYPEQGRFTTDLGNKAVAADPPLAERAHLPAFPEARLLTHSEEHGVFETPGDLPALGSLLLAVPGHVCPTTIKYPYSLWIDGDGRVAGRNEHAARDRN